MLIIKNSCAAAATKPNPMTSLSIPADGGAAISDAQAVHEVVYQATKNCEISAVSLRTLTVRTQRDTD